MAVFMLLNEGRRFKELSLIYSAKKGFSALLLQGGLTGKHSEIVLSFKLSSRSTHSLSRLAKWWSGVLDVASRKVLVFRLSNTLTADFCVEALEEAISKFGVPEIFNTDQGSQFTSEEWINVLKAADIAIGMDGKGRWIDNVFIERLWRSVKYEEVYLRAYANGTEARMGLTRYFRIYNAVRSHHSLEYRTPDEVYLGEVATAIPVAV